jgi:hypothetical protein
MAFAKTGSNYMESYVEDRLTSFHNTSEQSVKNYRQKTIAFLIACVVIISLPYLHLGMYIKFVLVFIY